MANDIITHDNEQPFVTMHIAGQLFGISVMAVQDVLRNLQVSRVPRAPETIGGVINIRGRVVTALNMRVRLGMPQAETVAPPMYVVVDHQQELFALMVDLVGDVVNLSVKTMEKLPANLDESWRSVSTGVFRMDDDLMLILNVPHIVDGMLLREVA
jgi:purine-binding chemotaxis protein CheW